MATRRWQPFAGAVTTAYEPLGVDFIHWKREQLQGIANFKLPTPELMWQGFLAVGQRPEELQNSLIQLQSRPEPPDVAFPIICATLASTAAEMEIATIESLGALAVAIFDRIAQASETGESGFFPQTRLKVTPSKWAAWLIPPSVKHD